MASSKNGTKNETKKAEENGSVTGDPAAKQETMTASTTVEKKSIIQESVYTIDEFCSNAQNLFHTMPECVKAALTERGIKHCTKAEAEKIVREFMKKEVK